VIEAERFCVNLGDAAAQAKAYAQQLGVPYAFLCNGRELLFWEWRREAYPRALKTFFRQDDLERRVPVPALEEQRRIVGLLARAEGIVRLRREARRKAVELIPAIFIDMFGDPATNPDAWPREPLSAVAQVISGVAKGRKLAADEAVELPYMRVANARDGYLDLVDVKTIEIKCSEVE